MLCTKFNRVTGNSNVEFDAHKMHRKCCQHRLALSIRPKGL